ITPPTELVNWCALRATISRSGSRAARSACGNASKRRLPEEYPRSCLMGGSSILRPRRGRETWIGTIPNPKAFQYASVPKRSGGEQRVDPDQGDERAAEDLAVPLQRTERDALEPGDRETRGCNVRRDRRDGEHAGHHADQRRSVG